MAIDINTLNTELSAYGTIIKCCECIENNNFIVVLENVTTDEDTIKTTIESHVLADYPEQVSCRLTGGVFKTDYKK